MAKAVETIVAFLKGNDVDADGIADAVKAKFAQMVIVDGDTVIGDGQIAVKKAEFDKIQSDMMDWKNKFREADKQVKSLKDDIEAAGDGDDKWKKAFEREKANNKKLEPLAKRLMDQQRATWKAAADKIPDTMKDKFRFPDAESDNPELSDDDVLYNIDKMAEYKAIGALQVDDTKPEIKPYIPGAPRINPAGKGPAIAGKDMSEIPANQRMEAGFGASKK